MSFAKLDQGITKSSIWEEKEYIRCVWIAFLAEKDENGYVRATYRWMRKTSNLDNDKKGTKFAEAIKCLESPDPDSRSKDYEGRRIEKVDGGWIVLNHERYKLHDDVIREQTRQRVRKFREKHNVTKCNVTKPLHSVSVSKSKSISESNAYAECVELLIKRVLERRQIKVTDSLKKKWLTTVRLMVIRDKRTAEDIKTLINECHDMQPNRGFTWADNILSMDKLRLRWNEGKIYIGMVNKDTNSEETEEVPEKPKTPYEKFLGNHSDPPQKVWWWIVKLWDEVKKGECLEYPFKPDSSKADFPEVMKKSFEIIMDAKKQGKDKTGCIEELKLFYSNQSRVDEY